MAQFEVPQFIDTESKIVGPLTIKQFGFVATSALACFFLYFTLALWAWIPVAIILMGAGASFAFIKINERPLYMLTIYAVEFFWGPKVFLWKRPVIQEMITIPTVVIAARRQALGETQQKNSNVAKLWQELSTTRNPIPHREKEPQPKLEDVREQFEVFRRTTGEKEVARRIDYR
ncbi:MAG: PrgI family protein [Candidatus Paceibacterota bacterium]|jgi:hypothetical protein